MTQQPRSSTPGTGSKTLSRGIQILEILAEAWEPLTIDETAQRLRAHRSNAYRLLRTLEAHGLVSRDDLGRFSLGARLVALAAGVANDLYTVALPELTNTADSLGITCFLCILDNHDCVTLASIMPRHVTASVAQRPGTRHPAVLGAPGKALLMQLPQSNWPADVSVELRAEVAAFIERGYASSHDEVFANLSSIAVPLWLHGHPPAAIGAVYITRPIAEKDIAMRLRTSANAISNALSGHHGAGSPAMPTAPRSFAPDETVIHDA